MDYFIIRTLQSTVGIYVDANSTALTIGEIKNDEKKKRQQLTAHEIWNKIKHKDLVAVLLWGFFAYDIIKLPGNGEMEIIVILLAFDSSFFFKNSFYQMT